MTVLRCPDTVAPETRSVSGGEFSVGRGPGVDWVLPDPERLLSKRHFAVAYRSGIWQLADTSTNGTFLNREIAPIGADDVRNLRDGDRVRLGAVRDRDTAGGGCRRAPGRGIGRQSVRRSVRHGSVRAAAAAAQCRSTNRTTAARASHRRRRNCRTTSIRWRRIRQRRRSTVRPRPTIRRSWRMRFVRRSPVGQVPLQRRRDTRRRSAAGRLGQGPAGGIGQPAARAAAASDPEGRRATRPPEPAPSPSAAAARAATTGCRRCRTA